MPLSAFGLWGQSFGDPGQARSFDYIVVGGGNAGLTIASRLSENPSITVAIIEAGGFYEIESPRNQIPGFMLSVPPGSSIDWSLTTEPQEHLNHRTMPYVAGKALGGGSARNFMAYHRPTVGTFDRWAELVGDESYRFAEVMPFFKKSVAFVHPSAAHLATELYDEKAYGEMGGPVKLSYPPYQLPLTQSSLKGFKKAGFELLDGINSGKLNGVGYFPLTVNPVDGTRSSSESSFLQSVLGRENLTVYTKTYAEKVVFNGKRVSGVEVRTQGVKYELGAKREVIVSSGWHRSPHLLLLSGIGPAADLEKHGITVVADRSGVGQNLCDHMVVEVINPVRTFTLTALHDPKSLNEATKEFLMTRDGPLTSCGTDFLAFEKIPRHLRSSLSPQAKKDLEEYPDDWPEMEYLPLSFTFTPTPPGTQNYMSFSFTNQSSLSRGTVTLQSADSSDPPVIDPKYFSHPTDREVFLAAFKRVREIAAEIDAINGPELLPGSAVSTDNDEQIMEFLRGAGAPFLHATSSCKMGRVEDEMAVVDSRCRVIGAEGLRVVDASAFPFATPGHPMSVVYMLAEKIAEDILMGLKPSR